MHPQFRNLDTGTPLTVLRKNFRRLTSVDEYPDISWLDNERRLDDFHDGMWHMIGIQASATFLIPLGKHYVIYISLRFLAVPQGDVTSLTHADVKLPLVAPPQAGA